MVAGATFFISVGNGRVSKFATTDGILGDTAGTVSAIESDLSHGNASQCRARTRCSATVRRPRSARQTLRDAPRVPLLP
jgi:hypothetical protein